MTKLLINGSKPDCRNKSKKARTKLLSKVVQHPQRNTARWKLLFDKKWLIEKVAKTNWPLKSTGKSYWCFKGIHSRLLARMSDLSKLKGDSVLPKPASPILTKVSPLVDKRWAKKRRTLQHKSTVLHCNRQNLKKSHQPWNWERIQLIMKCVVNSKPIPKKSTSAAVNTAQLRTNSTTLQKISWQHHQLFSNEEFGKSVRDTFKLKKRKKKTADSDTYGAVDLTMHWTTISQGVAIVVVSNITSQSCWAIWWEIRPWIGHKFLWQILHSVIIVETSYGAAINSVSFASECVYFVL